MLYVILGFPYVEAKLSIITSENDSTEYHSKVTSNKSLVSESIYILLPLQCELFLIKYKEI